MSEKDLSILSGRRDTHFSQTVRNLKSHDTLERRQIATYKNGTWFITSKGISFLEQNEELFNSIYDSKIPKKDIQEIVNRDFEALIVEEGALSVTSRKHRRRSKLLIERKKQELKQINRGRLSCLVCNFEFERTYGDHGKDYIEIHHLKPIHLMNTEGESLEVKTALKNLVPLCSNCHRMAHRKRSKVLDIKELKD